jgi:hypothetical protein
MDKNNPFRIITHINGKPIKESDKLVGSDTDNLQVFVDATKEEKRKEFKELLANDKDFGDEWQDTEEDFNVWLEE